MGTATSRPTALGLVALALATVGCGAGGKPSAAVLGASSSTTTRKQQSEPAHARTGTLAWLRPAAAPAGWRTVTIATGAVMRYPPDWHLVAGDAGTATAVLRGPDREFLGYLNLTPRQGDESLTNWTSFRVAHNAREGDRHVKALATNQGLRFRSGSGACVRDEYTTTTDAKYVELACLVVGRRATSVIVGAAPPQAWARISTSIKRAISAFTT